jgi:predicted component of type VI protein secretion system
VVQRVELSTAPGHPGAVDSLKLAELEQAPDGVWIVRPGYVPPLVALAAWPDFFARVVGRMRKLLAGWEDILLGDLETQVLSVAKSLRAHECLRRSRLHGWFLTQIDAAAPARTSGPSHADSVLAAHPFEVFRRLVELTLDVHAYQAAAAEAPALAAQVYDHRDLVGCFEPLLAELERRTRLPHGRAPYAPFVREGRVASCALPEVVESTRLYWLVRRGEGTDRDAPRAVKLAACGRLETVHRHALRGVAVKPLASVPFRHDFDPDVAFYEIVAEGEEWDFALREGKLGYVAEGPIAACETYLFWRAV